MGMARIAGENADALGEERPENEGDKATTDLASGAAEHLGPPDETAIWEGLKSVYDPEIPVNIVDLGLVYSMDTKETESGEGYLVEVQMTLTAPGCGMGPAIASDAESRVSQVPGVREARVELVWDPPWNQEMISEEGKMHLGLI
jgi:probable FeS assembly SUF system protein SufT